MLTKTVDYNVSSYIPTAYRYTIYEYDELKRMVGYSEINKSSQPTEEEINENKLIYKYDIEDKLTEIRYPNNANDELKGIKLEYNDYNWLTKIKGIIDVDGSEVDRDIREYEYYTDSKVKTIKEYRGFLENASGYINKSYEYDLFDRTIKMTYADSSNLNSVSEQYTYSYDKNSNITSETIINNYPVNESEKINETRNYTYDSLNRMKTSSITNNTNQTVSNIAYNYDKVGNCILTVENGVTTSNKYNALNQLVQKDVAKGSTRISTTYYWYDANGNQITEQTVTYSPNKQETIQKEYDVNNQLTKVINRNGDTSATIVSTQENTYNSDGQRISKTESGVTTYYYYQSGVLLYTTDGEGNKTSQNIVGPQNNIIATIRYEEDGQSAYFYNKDIRTSVTNIVDDSGVGVVGYKYDDYGTTTKYGDQDFYNEICYTSGVYDELTGLYYLNARYYNPTDAVFITQDSYRGEKDNCKSWNLYCYTNGNPIAYIDTTGHDAYYYSTGKKMPSEAVYYKYDYSNVRKGDIIYEANGGFGITGHIAIVEGKYTDSVTGIKYVRIIEAISKGVKRGIIDDIRIYEKDASFYRVKGASNKQRKEAVKFCVGQLGKKYRLDLSKNTSEDSKNWYCSELVWAAYMNQDINIEKDAKVGMPGVTPREIKNSSKVKKRNMKLIQHFIKG